MKLLEHPDAAVFKTIVKQVPRSNVSYMDKYTHLRGYLGT